MPPPGHNAQPPLPDRDACSLRRRNPEPILCVRNVNVVSPSIVGNNHLRMRINSSGTHCNSIWFSKGHYLETITGLPVDIAFTPQINTWGGLSDIQLKMHDVAISASN